MFFASASRVRGHNRTGPGDQVIWGAGNSWWTQIVTLKYTPCNPHAKHGLEVLECPQHGRRFYMNYVSEFLEYQVQIMFLSTGGFDQPSCLLGFCHLPKLSFFVCRRSGQACMRASKLCHSSCDEQAKANLPFIGLKTSDKTHDLEEMARGQNAKGIIESCVRCWITHVSHVTYLACMACTACMDPSDFIQPGHHDHSSDHQVLLRVLPRYGYGPWLGLEPKCSTGPARLSGGS